MNGIEILSSQTIYDTILPSWVGGISLIIFVVSAILCGIFAEKFETANAIICLILAVTNIVVLVLAVVPNETDINHIEHKVIIDDSVSMNEFFDKYEIIDQEGKIYTVKEKANEE